MYTGERQATRIRIHYLQAVLRRDVSFFDVNTRPGEIMNNISSDVLLIQNAISEKVFVYPMVYFIFNKIWQSMIAYINVSMNNLISLSSILEKCYACFFIGKGAKYCKIVVGYAKH